MKKIKFFITFLTLGIVLNGCTTDNNANSETDAATATDTTIATEVEAGVSENYAVNMEAQLGEFQTNLHTLIAELQAERKSDKALIFENDIKSFEFYKNDANFREFVDYLLELGYKIKQEEGQYYLYAN